jgi:DNA-binding response OmpR family regulator
MLPGMDGFTVLQRARGRIGAAILILTANDSMSEIVRRLDLGADDSLTKPFCSRFFWRGCAQSAEEVPFPSLAC